MFIRPPCDLITMHEGLVTKSQNNAPETWYNMCVKKKQPKRRFIKMSALKLNQNNFDSAVKSEKPVLIDFYADWCGPCRMVLPLVEEIAAERDDILVAKVNVDEEPALASQFGVVSIPTLVVMKNGEVVNKSMGARPKAQILELLEG